MAKTDIVKVREEMQGKMEELRRELEELREGQRHEGEGDYEKSKAVWTQYGWIYDTPTYPIKDVVAQILKHLKLKVEKVPATESSIKLVKETEKKDSK